MTDDEREALASFVTNRLADNGYAVPRPEVWLALSNWEALNAPLRRSEVPEPSAEGYTEFEGWEHEMFRHQPVLSMSDGSIAGCQCLDRVFVKGEDWGTHLATVITARITAQGEPSDAQVEAAARELLPEGLGPWEKAKPEWHEHARRRARAALRAAGGVR
ncbi:hypothetical protein PBI_HYPERION_9 [Microbacterium phage Hyperion]|uniref:Uncharacterized protein n=1 Tax=Microbacterium phage Hyperion TaxID=2182354 RepID=A0A2U8UIP3_9CAUD|nr:hypothetical protein HOT27_gp009 [Microbacterium phage Hyperion]AWN03527.1 hypothetical protein PBI_HYPERION_9 [Microbacterium phage Hyperion]